MTVQVFAPIVVAVVFTVYLGVAVRTWLRLRGTRVVICPETMRPAAVRVDVGHAATTAMWESADIRLATCSRWPARHACDEGCLAQIEASPEGTLARTMAAEFFEGRHCAICQRPIGALQAGDPQPGFMTPVNREVVAWDALPPQILPDAIAGRRPLCADCTLAESSHDPSRATYGRDRMPRP